MGKPRFSELAGISRPSEGRVEQPWIVEVDPIVMNSVYATTIVHKSRMT